MSNKRTFTFKPHGNRILTSITTADGHCAISSFGMPPWRKRKNQKATLTKKDRFFNIAKMKEFDFDENDQS